MAVQSSGSHSIRWSLCKDILRRAVQAIRVSQLCGKQPNVLILRARRRKGSHKESKTIAQSQKEGRKTRKFPEVCRVIVEQHLRLWSQNLQGLDDYAAEH